MSPTSYQTAPPRAVVEPGVYEAHRASASGRGWTDALVVSKPARELDEGYGEEQADDHEGDHVGILEELSRTLSHSNLLRQGCSPTRPWGPAACRRDPASLLVPVTATWRCCGVLRDCPALRP